MENRQYNHYEDTVPIVFYGGGGRIAVYADSGYSLTREKFSAKGSAYSGAGTIFIKRPNEENGVLIGDNGGQDAPDSTTVLPFIGLRYSDKVQNNLVIDSTVKFLNATIIKEARYGYDSITSEYSLIYKADTVPMFKNHHLIFTTNPGLYDYAFRILDHDSTTLIVDTTEHKPAEFASDGSMYIGVYYFDTVFVKGGAKLYTEDLIESDYIIVDSISSFSDYHEQHGSLLPAPSDIRLAKRSSVGKKTPAELGANEVKNIPTVEKKDRPIIRFVHKLKTLFDFKKDNRQASIDASVVQVAAVQNLHEEPVEELSAILHNKVNDKVNSKPICQNGDPIYEYDILGRVISMTSPAGATEYHYDTITGRLDKITSPEGKEFSYSYNHGQLSSMDYPNGITANYAFDDNGNLEDLDYQYGGASVKRYSYGYDKNGMRTDMTDNDGVHAYTYDPLYQIIEATSPKVQRPLEQFAYDSVGNWTGGGRVHNELNQLTEDNSCMYAYDADGNMTEKVSKGSGDTTHFTWDIESKLTEVKKPGTVVRYVYDALGRRVSKEVNGVVTQFRYNGQDLILEMNAKDSITANYTFGSGIDNPLQMHRNGRNLYYVKDGLGSVTALTDSVGSVVHEYAYSVFGEIVDESGESIKNPFTYTAREWEPEVGLYFYRARYYDPKIGRFLGEDPIGLKAKDFNLYRYVHNSPLVYIDPLGLMCASSYWETVWNNFITTNNFLPGLFAPAIGPLGTGILTSSSVATLLQSKTFVQWALTGFKGMVSGAATLTSVETGIIVGATTLINWALVTAAWETGVGIGSMIGAAFEECPETPCGK